MMPVDGNAIAGTLADVFGGDMTSAGAVCAHCGQAGVLADVAVYVGGPGIVGRCRSCENVLVVITERRGTYCVDLTGLSHLSPPSALP
ncbi:MAG TPA: DUF6510 family protein [Kribbella sp.]|nr:DUF6510 family protein [Kribbella sp.]